MNVIVDQDLRDDGELADARAELRQRRKDWDALVTLIAVTLGDEDERKRGEQEYGEPKRMTLDVWRQAITTEIQRDAEFRMPPVPPKVYEERDRMIAAHGPASLGLPENLLRSDGPARALAVELGKELKDA